MKKKILITTLLIALLAILPTFTYAGTDPINDGLTIINNPLNTYLGKPVRVKYNLSRQAWVSAVVLKNGKIINRLKNNKLQNTGNNYVYWKGKDGKGNTVPSGEYAIKISARDSAKAGTITYARQRRVKVTNSLIFSEYFDRPDGLIADETVPDALGKWKVTSGSLRALGGQAYTADDVFRVVTNKTDFTDFTLSSNMKTETMPPGDYDGMRLFFRYQDQYNLYVASIQKDGCVVLEKKVAGAYVFLGAADFGAYQINKWYNLKVVNSGTSIKVYVDGILYLDVIDSSYSSGRVGLRSDNQKVWFDDFKVDANR